MFSCWYFVLSFQTVEMKSAVKCYLSGPEGTHSHIRSYAHVHMNSTGNITRIASQTSIFHPLLLRTSFMEEDVHNSKLLL